MINKEIIERYNSLPEYAQTRVETLINHLLVAADVSRNYCINVCPKCGAVEPCFTKGGFLTVVSKCSDVQYAINGLL